MFLALRFLYMHSNNNIFYIFLQVFCNFMFHWRSLYSLLLCNINVYNLHNKIPQ